MIATKHPSYSLKVNKWIVGARPKTLAAAVAPVVTATALANHLNNSINWVNSLLALLVAVLLQIGVNYSNDYSDGIKGTDKERVGPIRLVATGIASAKAVKSAALLTYFLSALVGLILSLRTSPWLMLLGLLAIISAWFYTGGKNPYGYRGFGEVSVFLFFGLFATIGTYFVTCAKFSPWALLLGVQMGLLSCAILAVNNLRDLPRDKDSGKRTLAVRLGDKKARTLLISLIALAFLIQLVFLKLTPLALLPIMMLPFAVRIFRQIQSGAFGKDLIPSLAALARLQIFMSVWIVISLISSKA